MNASVRKEQGAQSPSLGELPHNLLLHKGGQELGLSLWGAGEPSLVVGIPRLVQAQNLGKWLRADDVALELTRVPGDGASRACVLVPQSDAARWVDRALGGDGRIGRAAQLRQAEHGVLAYLFSRCMAVQASSLQVCDVDQANRARVESHLGTCVVWPVGIVTPLGLVDVRVLLSEHFAASIQEDALLSLILREDLDREDWTALSPGDVLLSDGIPLTLTVGGLIGDLELAVAGCAERLSVRLECDVLRLRERAPPRADSAQSCSLEIILARGTLGLLELARAASGQPVTFATPIPSERVALHYPGCAPKLGELVVHRGAFGVRICEPAAP